MLGCVVVMAAMAVAPHASHSYHICFPVLGFSMSGILSLGLQTSVVISILERRQLWWGLDAASGGVWSHSRAFGPQCILSNYQRPKSLHFPTFSYCKGFASDNARSLTQAQDHGGILRGKSKKTKMPSSLHLFLLYNLRHAPWLQLRTIYMENDSVVTTVKRHAYCCILFCKRHRSNKAVRICLHSCMVSNIIVYALLFK